MKTLTLEVPDEVFEPLARRARAAGLRLEQWVLERLETTAQETTLPDSTNGAALQSDLANGEKDFADDPMEKFIGALRDIEAPADWAENHDFYIGQQLYREMQGES